MAKKKILSVGFELASDDVEYCRFDSDMSLLDWDIILFKPDIDEFIDYSDTYNGKPSLSDSKSFRLKERSEHWRREIKDAVESGKTVIVYLSDLTEVFIDSGERRYSGTGRNQKTTVLVNEYNNYYSIPATISPIKSKGSSIKLASRGADVVSIYWKEFEEHSCFKTILTGEKVPACLLTKTGDKPVGAIYHSKNSNGALLLLPDIDFYPNSFFEEKDDETHWSQSALEFSGKYISTIVSLDKALKSEGEITPEPEWAKHSEFRLEKEKTITSELLKTEESLEKLQTTKDDLLDELKDAGRLRNLLFEKGKPLEYAIIDALKLLRFNVTQYDDGESEFDAVFESAEGRLIGEAEGKDRKAINIDKLRQLALNIHEDLEREEVESPAKAVLFGNAFRLEPVADREEPFTKKCISASTTSATALIHTPDLFNVAKYLSENKDAKFATKCRKEIINTVGRVQFPEIPNKESKGKKETKSET